VEPITPLFSLTVQATNNGVPETNQAPRQASKRVHKSHNTLVRVARDDTARAICVDRAKINFLSTALYDRGISHRSTTSCHLSLLQPVWEPIGLNSVHSGS
jgi:hypothetical protein